MDLEYIDSFLQVFQKAARSFSSTGLYTVRAWLPFSCRCRMSPPDGRKMSWNCPLRSSVLYVASEINHILQGLALLDDWVVIVLHEEIHYGMRAGESAVPVE